MANEARLRLSKPQSRVWNYFNDPKSLVEEIFYGGAAFGGKTYLGCAWQIYRRIMYPGTIGLIGRSTNKDLMDTTFKTFVRVWNDYGRYNPHGVTMAFVGTPKNAVFSNGSEIMFRYTKIAPGDSDGANLGSLELTDLFIDELPENDEEHIEILKSRVRYKLIHGRPAILFAGNPAGNWVMKRYIQDDFGTPVELPEDIVVVRANISDNPDKEAVEGALKRLTKMNSDYHRDRLLHGIWGADKENKEPFFYSYDTKRHKQPAPIYEDAPLYISFDFNIDPTSAVIGQKVYGKGVFFTNELQKKGGTEVLCGEILKAGFMEHPNFIFVTGDSSGSKGSTSAGMEPGGRHITDYSIIQKTLRIEKGQIKHNRKINERLAYSAKVCSYMLKTLPVYIDPSCVVLHKDLRTAKRTPDGGLLKNRTSHKQDIGDAFRYLVHILFPGGIDDIDKFAATLENRPTPEPPKARQEPTQYDKAEKTTHIIDTFDEDFPGPVPQIRKPKKKSEFIFGKDDYL